MITCRCCLKEKQDDEFYNQSFRGKIYKRNCCIKCQLEYQQKSRDKARQTKSYYKEIQSITKKYKVLQTQLKQ